MTEIYEVVLCGQSGGGWNSQKEFESHDEALQYIKDMLKYHKDRKYTIEKYYKG